jgi:hypothetical protein
LDLQPGRYSSMLFMTNSNAHFGRVSADTVDDRPRARR